MTTRQSVEFIVAPPSVGVAVSVRIQNISDRWLAVADGPGGQHVGIGASARDALASALMPLGAGAAAILMADPALFGASLRLLAA